MSIIITFYLEGLAGSGTLDDADQAECTQNDSAMIFPPPFAPKERLPIHRAMQNVFEIQEKQYSRDVRELRCSRAELLSVHFHTPVYSPDPGPCDTHSQGGASQAEDSAAECGIAEI